MGAVAFIRGGGLLISFILTTFLRFLMTSWLWLIPVLIPALCGFWENLVYAVSILDLRLWTRLEKAWFSKRNLEINASIFSLFFELKWLSPLPTLLLDYAPVLNISLRLNDISSWWATVGIWCRWIWFPRLFVYPSVCISIWAFES
jgi:hypothetical protein